MATFVQQFEDNGRLVNKFVDENGLEFFEDAGAMGGAAVGNPIYGAAPTAEQIQAQVPYAAPIYGGGGQVESWTGIGAPQGAMTPEMPSPGPVVSSDGGVSNVTQSNTGGDIWVEDERERRHWVNGVVVERIPKTKPGQVPLVANTTGGTERAYWQNRAAMEAADQAARLAYQDWLMRTGNDEAARKKATDAWSQAFAEKQFEHTKQQGQDQTALGVLNLNAGLRGPSNYLSYLRTLSNTPEGLKSLVGQFAGRYGTSRQQSAVPGATYERQSMDTLVRDLGQGGPAGAAGAAGAADASGIALPVGNQWNADAVNTLSKNPTQWGLWNNLLEESGRDPGTEYANFLSSLPRYGGPRAAAVRLT